MHNRLQNEQKIHNSKIYGYKSCAILSPINLVEPQECEEIQKMARRQKMLKYKMVIKWSWNINVHQASSYVKMLAIRTCLPSLITFGTCSTKLFPK